jgi:hypothetical protein
MDFDECTSYAETFSWMVDCANKGLSMKIPHTSHGITTAIHSFKVGLGANYHIEEYRSASGVHSVLTAPKPFELPSRHLVVHVPAGIGDIAWVMMKLQAALGLNGTCDLLVSGEGPKRGREFAELYPCVKNVTYSDVGYQIIHKKSAAYNYSSLEQAFDNEKEIYLSANSHLELGGRMESYLPHYPVRYDLANLDHSGNKPPKVNTEVFNIGIYPSSYKTNKEWNCGTPDKWCERIKDMQAFFMGTTGKKVQFYLIGAKFDRRFAAEISRLLSTSRYGEIKVANTVGLLHISSTIQLIEQLNVLVSFPSGIGIIGSMVDTPTVMMMPEHLAPMEYKWVDPTTLNSKRFIQLQLAKINTDLLDIVCNELNY